ncbi:CRISPR-associated endonuclease Cas2 [Lyngbya sp. CCY1209]|uniref:CRISPR-associated endonuclease Cas2 n=1 Tax=Lyngbya sp. CCY1209 TaxID=2886103 RepID=UPI002D202BB2|nr:CRISPR-associated endonuclease Cas2 [Lyngbya sp. CCY1209]MEB3887251.1 CRISPR-associated endonuclease Cas2 [Lyngbya sp. CCY1209]
MANFWLVCYDVRDDKRRNKLAKLLEQRCQRVQYSVFECPLEEKVLEDLLNKRWLRVLKLEEDSLRAYPLNPATKAQVKVYGGPAPYEPPDFLIL